ncbi:4'-phosphopantetheinyl transferase superfamily protein [Streptomyces sp. NPDC046939]|uniref:4'-phosphopantetheinyl transferase family protein n=1 Tax=Streptomyces sp. NPDC046939 TaxID=3155376 RepID=UPI003410A332
MATRPTTPTRPLALPGSAMTPGQLDLWLIRSPEDSAQADLDLDLSDLDEAERARTDGFRRRSDGLLYATAHVGLRRLLSRYTGQAPGKVRFTREPCPGCGASHGRPALAGSPVPLHFSLSHSSGVALLGFASVPVGVDVERLPREDTVDTCETALHPSERAELAAVPTADRRAVFGWLWTRKEAHLKALGVGLSRGTARDYLGVCGAEQPSDWAVHSIPCFTDYVAAVVVPRSGPTEAGVRCIPANWLDASDAWRTETAPAGVRLPLAVASRTTTPLALWSLPMLSSTHVAR